MTFQKKQLVKFKNPYNRGYRASGAFLVSATKGELVNLRATYPEGTIDRVPVKDLEAVTISDVQYNRLHQMAIVHWTERPYSCTGYPSVCYLADKPSKPSSYEDDVAMDYILDTIALHLVNS